MFLQRFSITQATLNSKRTLRTNGVQKFFRVNIKKFQLAPLAFLRRQNVIVRHQPTIKQTNDRDVEPITNVPTYERTAETAGSLQLRRADFRTKPSSRKSKKAGNSNTSNSS